MRQLNTNINPNRQTLNTSISPFVQTLNAQIDSKLIYAFSPIANVSLLPNGNYLITITDRDGTTTAQIRHGEKGDTGNGIASIDFNDDYTLTFHFTDGTEDFTTEPIRGAKGDKGDTGNGISSIVLNDDYTLTINYTEGQSYTTSSIRGEKGDTGVSISEVSLNDDYTLTINFSDGTFTRTTSIRGQTGPAPAITTNKANKVTTIYADGQPIGIINDGADGHSPVVTTSKSEGVTTIYIDGVSAGTIIDGHSPEMSASKVGKVTTISVDGQALAVINDGVDAVAPVITANKENKTTSIYADGVLIGTVLDGQDGNSPVITTSRNGKITIILADGNPVGTVNDGEVGDPGVYVGENEPTDPDVQLWIDTDGTPNYDIPTGGSTGQVLTKTSGDDYDVEWANVPTDSVQDVQINGTSVLNQGVANIPIAGSDGNTPILGVVAVNQAYGIKRNATSGILQISTAAPIDCKTQTGGTDYKPITVYSQHAAAFYGLAKAAGDSTQSQSSNAVGTYTDDAKSAIQAMLDVPSTSDVPSVDNTLSVTGAAADAKKVGDELTQLSGDLTEKADKVQSATNGNFAGLDANGNLTDSGKKASDFLTEHQSLAGYVKDTDYASSSNAGVVIVDSNNGIGIESQHKLYVNYAESNLIKSGVGNYRPISPPRQHESTFYGLAKAAGDSTQSASSNAVGTYTEDAKKAIRQMLGLGEWFKLWDDTTTEEVANYVINTDSNGNPFILSNAIIQIIAPASTSQAVYLSVYNANDLRSQVNLGNIIGTGVMRTIVRYERIADSWNVMMNTPTNNYRDIDKTNMQMYCGLLRPAEPVNIAKIQLQTTAFPVGTQFIVYGKQS